MKPVVWVLGATGLLGADRGSGGPAQPLALRPVALVQAAARGQRMTGLMYDAITAMGAEAPERVLAAVRPRTRSLRHAHRLLRLSTTHSRSTIRRSFTSASTGTSCISLSPMANGDVESDFDLENAAGAGVCGACDLVLSRCVSAGADQGDRRICRAEFPRLAGPRVPGAAISIATRARISTPRWRPFIDGSVLNNRPFREAIPAIRDRPAYRQVDRRLVYIDPDPASAGAGPPRPPGLLRHAQGRAIGLAQRRSGGGRTRLGERFQRSDEAAAGNHRECEAQCQPVRCRDHRHAAGRPDRIREIRAWREQINAQVEVDAGFAYEGYIRLKLASVRSFIASLIAAFAARRRFRNSPARSRKSSTPGPPRPGYGRQQGSGIRPQQLELAAQQVSALERVPAGFRLDYRKRRLHLLIEGRTDSINRRSNRISRTGNLKAIDALKGNS